MNEPLDNLPLDPATAGAPRKGRGWGIGALIGLLIFGAAGGFFWWRTRSAETPETKIQSVTPPPTESHNPPPLGKVYLIRDLIINPADGRRHFLVSVGLEYFPPIEERFIADREVLLRDNLISFFSAQPLEVLTNIRYRQAIRTRVKKIIDYQLGQGVVSRVFFEKWVVQ